MIIFHLVLIGFIYFSYSKLTLLMNQYYYH